MNKISSYIGTVLAIVAIVIATSASNKVPTKIAGAPGVIGPQGPRGEQGIKGEQGEPGKDGVTTVITKIVKEDLSSTVPKFGAVSTLNQVDNPYVSINGIQQYYYNQPMSATSSVLCSLANPFNATSTLVSYSAVTTVNLLGAQSFDISTSSTAFASSSLALVRAYNTPTGQSTILWQPLATTTSSKLIGVEATGVIGNSNIVLAPSDFITFRLATGTPGTYAAYNQGSCKGVVQRL